jgi:hypothetical protein
VAETSFRYFYQVVIYGAFYCTFLLVVMAVLIHERSNKGLGVDGKWISIIVLYVPYYRTILPALSASSIS